MTEKQVRVDVVIPVYNEENDLAPSVTKLRQFLLDNVPYDWRIVIADNASTDRTLDIAAELSESFPTEVTYVHLDQKGRGRALRRAWTESDAKPSRSAVAAATPPPAPGLRLALDTA